VSRSKRIIKKMNIKAPMLVCLLALSGCLESEKSCRDRLVEELDSAFRHTEKMLDDPATISTDLEIRRWQVEILNQKARIGQLYRSQSVSVCDFYVDGMKLVRK
jgi:hypothetical protein